MSLVRHLGGGLLAASLITFSVAPTLAATCSVDAVQGAAPAGVTIDAAIARTVTAALPAHCEVTAHLVGPGVDGAPADRIGFRLELPDAGWNGRFMMIGGGGFDGGYGTFADGFHGLTRGYATAATDTGHDGGDDAAWALHDPTKIVDFGFHAVHLVRDASVAIHGGWAGQPVQRSIFAGCSTGGRMALMAAQRYPADFQGVIAGAPAWDYEGLMMELPGTSRRCCATGSTTSQ